VEGAALEAAPGLAAIEPLLAEARELAWQPLVARLEYDHALRLSRLRRNREAEIELQEAAVDAEEAHADSILLDVWTRLLYLVGYQEYRVADGLLWGRYAKAALARHGGDDRRAGRLFAHTGLVLLNEESRLEEARDNFQRSLDLAQKVDGPASKSVADAMTELSMVLFTMGRPEQAIPFERDARAIMERALGPESIDVAVSLGNEGEELLESGRPDDALTLLERSAALQERLGRNDSAVLGVIGRALRRKGRFQDALDLDQRTLAMVGRNEQPDAYDLSFPNVAVALDLLALGRGKEALPFAERGARLRQVTTASSERGEARFVLARALWEAGNPGRARQQAADALEDYRLMADRYGGRFGKARDEIDVWLAAHQG
jgi:tetratricopeptide (TPR) repeat protein